jgi:hypothetical protein
MEMTRDVWCGEYLGDDAPRRFAKGLLIAVFAAVVLWLHFQLGRPCVAWHRGHHYGASSRGHVAVSCKKFAIVMGYYNRKPQTLSMLESLNQYAGAYDVEVIIADDMSDADHLLDAHISECACKVRLIKIKANVRTWFNCAISYNVAINAVPDDADIVVIQNPEVYHCGNILQHAAEELGTQGKYLTYPVYGSPDSRFNEAIAAAGRSPNRESVDSLKLSSIPAVERRVSGISMPSTSPTTCTFVRL